MGMTRAWVSVCKNSPALRERIDTLQNEANNYITTARQRIDELSARSLDVLEGILKDKDDKTITPRLKVDVAKDILDRAGHGAVKKVESKNLHASLSKEDVDKIVGRAFSVDLSEIIEGEVVSD
jgi:FixJ family two-component response regulator